MMPERLRCLLPEEDELDDPDADDGIDFQLPGDLWFRVLRRGKFDVASYTSGMTRSEPQSDSH